ncbi:MAG: hypothetical protein IT323_08255 [Anaerolineae bacterium]|nr:hypothetical protein [Anaerolineae bacterium]
MSTPKPKRAAPADDERAPLRKRLLYFAIFALIILAIVGGTVFLVWNDIQTRLQAPVREPAAHAEGISISTFVAYDVKRAFPTGLAEDGNGGLIVTLLGTGAVDRVSADGQTANFQQLTAPGAIARGPGGVLYVIDYQAADSRTFGQLKRITPDGQVSYFGDALNEGKLPLFAQLAVDGAGNLYVSHPDAASVWRVTPDGVAALWWSVPPVGGVAGQPIGLAYAAQRNALLVADPGTGSIYSLSLAGGAPVAETLYRQAGLDLRTLAVDAAGVVYTAYWTADNGVLSRLEPDGTLVTLADQFRAPMAILARDTELFIANSGLPAMLTGVSDDPPFTVSRVQVD